LAIINAHFFIPTSEDNRISKKLQDLIWHILTPNPNKRPSISEIESILDSWEEIDKIKINSDAVKNKQAYYKRIENSSVKRSKVPLPSGELTSEDIAKIQERIRKEQEKKKKQLFVPVYDDYQEKMKQELYNQGNKQEKNRKISGKSEKDIIPNKNKTINSASKVHFEDKHNISSDKESKHEKSSFWDSFQHSDFEQETRKSIQKRAKSTKREVVVDPFAWDFDNSLNSKLKRFII